MENKNSSSNVDALWYYAKATIVSSSFHTYSPADKILDAVSFAVSFIVLDSLVLQERQNVTMSCHITDSKPIFVLVKNLTTIEKYSFKFQAWTNTYNVGSKVLTSLDFVQKYPFMLTTLVHEKKVNDITSFAVHNISLFKTNLPPPLSSITLSGLSKNSNLVKSKNEPQWIMIVIIIVGCAILLLMQDFIGKNKNKRQNKYNWILQAINAVAQKTKLWYSDLYTLTTQSERDPNDYEMDKFSNHISIHYDKKHEGEYMNDDVDNVSEVNPSPPSSPHQTFHSSAQNKWNETKITKVQFTYNKPDSNIMSLPQSTIISSGADIDMDVTEGAVYSNVIVL